MLVKLKPGGSDEPETLLSLLEACHERIRSFTLLAIEAASVNEADDELLIDACARVRRYFSEALPHHVADEEESLLPRLRGQSVELDRTLETMADQHRAHEPLFGALFDALGAVEEAPQSPTARGKLLETAKTLQTELDEHLELEESLLFPAVDHWLTSETQATIIDELRLRRRRKRTRTKGPSPGSR